MKIYIILYDSNKKILVGEGGIVGDRTRKGYHLPGGKIKMHEDEIQAALRELEEETGITQTLLNDLGAELEWGPLYPLKKSVSFISLHVQNIDIEQLVDVFQRPQIVEPLDEPFERLSTLEWTPDSWNNPKYFNKAFFTNWFSEGLEAVYRELFD